MSKPIDWASIREEDDDDDDGGNSSSSSSDSAPVLFPTVITGASASFCREKAMRGSTSSNQSSDQVLGSASSSVSSAGPEAASSSYVARPGSAPPHMMLTSASSVSPGRKRQMGTDNEPLQTASGSMGDIHSGLFPAAGANSTAYYMSSSGASGFPGIRPSRSPMQMWKSSSRTGSPHQSPHSQSSSPPSLLAEQLRTANILGDGIPIDAFEASLIGQGNAGSQGHYTTVERHTSSDPAYAYSRAFGTDIVPCDELVGLDSAMRMLESCIAAPLASVLVPCVSPIIVLLASANRGCRTLVRSFCSQRGCRNAAGPVPPLLNNITYRFLSGSELDANTGFFPKLFQLATSMWPCVVTIHRAYGRGKHNRAYEHAVARIMEAYIPYRERNNNTRLPLFWLVFIDEPAISDLLSNQFEIENRCVLNDFTIEEANAYMTVRIRQQLRQILVNESDVQQVMETHRYFDEIRRVIDANPALLLRPADGNSFVNYLFGLAPRRFTVCELRDRDDLGQLDPELHLPYVPSSPDMATHDSDFSMAAAHMVEVAASARARLDAQALERDRNQTTPADMARYQAQMRNRG